MSMLAMTQKTAQQDTAAQQDTKAQQLTAAQQGQPLPSHSPTKTTGDPSFLIGTLKLDEFSLTANTINHLTFSNRDKFQHSSIPLRSSIRCAFLSAVLQPQASSLQLPELLIATTLKLESLVTRTKQSLGSFLIATFRTLFRYLSPLVARRMHPFGLSYD
jgi:hypothetical protein